MHTRIHPLVAASLVLALSPACASLRSTRRAEGLRLTLEQTAGRGERVDFTGALPSYSWADDGVHLEFTADDQPVWIEPTSWMEAPVPAANAEQGDDLWRVFAQLDGVDEELAHRIADARAQGGEEGTLRKVDGDLWFASDGSARRLTTRGSESGIELEELAPNGKAVAFVVANNLYFVDTGTGEERALSTDGDVNTFNGKLDWVYQEEIYGRGRFKAFWWSPNSEHVAFLRLDETAVHEFTVIDHIEDGHFRVKPEVTKYPKVGDPNPTVGLGVASATSATDVRWIDLGFEESEPLVVRVDWTPDGDRLVYMLQDRIQTWLDLHFVDVTNLADATLFRETSSAWTNRAPAPRWLDDGSFLWLSERTGQRHIYRYDASGELLTTVTKGPWSVASIDAVDEAAGRLWFGATKDGAVNSNVYRVDLDGSHLTRLTTGDGAHSVTFNRDRSMFLDRHSSLTSPPRLALFDGDGNELREIGVAASPDRDAYATGEWELFEVEARDGFLLDVSLLKPVDFDPSRSYPVWLPTYSGPNAPSVRNRWNGSAWYQFLAQNGVIVMQVNVRSASGKGIETTATCYRQLGIQELMDLEDAVAWLTALPWADGQRVGITGGSYGGFMTAFALTHSDTFSVGVAASGVYDWRMYDSIYTKRYMQTPDLNPDGYAATSVIASAGNLRGHLVITHGVMDDNVHLQNAIQLVYALQNAGKDFELMLYPQNRHGIRDAELRWHDRRLVWRTIQERLIGG